MNCIISSEILDPEELKKKLKEVPDMAGLELASVVSTKVPYELGESSITLRIAVLGLWHKKTYIELYCGKRCVCKSVPCKNIH